MLLSGVSYVFEYKLAESNLSHFFSNVADKSTTLRSKASDAATPFSVFIRNPISLAFALSGYSLGLRIHLSRTFFPTIVRMMVEEESLSERVRDTVSSLPARIERIEWKIT